MQKHWVRLSFQKQEIAYQEKMLFWKGRKEPVGQVSLSLPSLCYFLKERDTLFILISQKTKAKRNSCWFPTWWWHQPENFMIFSHQVSHNFFLAEYKILEGKDCLCWGRGWYLSLYPQKFQQSVPNKCILGWIKL